MVLGNALVSVFSQVVQRVVSLLPLLRRATEGIFPKVKQ